MMRSISAGTCTAMVMAAAMTALAQTAPQQTNSASSEQHVTVTGCLEAAPATPTDSAASTQTAGTTGTTPPNAAASDPANAKFVLARATVSQPGDETHSNAAAGATTTTTSGNATQTYRLIANPSALVPHVGKKLELTGVLVDESSASGATTTTAQQSSATGPVLRVESGKILAASCQN